MIKTKYWLSILAISVVLIAGSLAVSPIAIADDDETNDVVVMQCTSSGLTYKTFLASSSANAPAVPTGAATNCAQNLADLLDAGFEIQNVLADPFGGGMFVTLIR